MRSWSPQHENDKGNEQIRALHLVVVVPLAPCLGQRELHHAKQGTLEEIFALGELVGLQGSAEKGITEAIWLCICL